MPESKIIRNGSAFLLEIDGKRMPLYGYMSYQPSCADYEGFRKAGVHLFFTGVYAGDRGINQYSGTRPFRPGFWKGYGQYDFSAVDEDFHIILDGAQPDVDYLIPRLMIEPPSWWEADNPGELCRDAQGTPIHHSYQSQKWLDDTRRMLFDFQAWLEDSGWAAWVPGWHIACGNTEEFIRPKQHPLQFTDYSGPARRAFAAWAQARYGGIAALNAAWNMKLNGFEDVTIPSPAQRMFGSDGRLRNPELERYTVDFYRFYNESHSQAAISLCRLAKEATGGRQVIGAFFGYTVCDQESGQHAANMVMQSDAVDFLASPFTYTDNRGQGVDWAFQGSVESAALHGKPWFMEADVRTYLSRPISQCMPYANPVVSKVYDSPVWWGPKDLAGSLGQMKKAFARVITHNTAVWWFDMWGGWYKDLNLMAFHKQAARIYRDHVEAGGSENAAPIALFMDDEIFDEVSGNDYASRMNGRMWKNLGYAGTPYRMFMMDDFEAVDPERFRLAVFCSVRHWSEGQKRALERWKRDDRVLAFTGPLDLRFVTGVAVETGDGLEPLPGEKNRCDPPLIARRLRLVAQPGDVVLSCAGDGGAVELMRREAGCSIYVTTAVDITADCARMLTAAAGGQIYTFDGDVAYASGKYVAVHAASDGVKRIAVPLRAVLRDVFTGEALPGNETFVDVEMKLGETRMLCIEPM